MIHNLSNNFHEFISTNVKKIKTKIFEKRITQKLSQGSFLKTLPFPGINSTNYLTFVKITFP
jgi:hypothetical protein